MATSQSSSLRQVRGAARRPNTSLNVIIEHDGMDEIDAMALKTGTSNLSVPVMMVMESGFPGSTNSTRRGYRPRLNENRWTAHERRISFDDLYDATEESSEDDCPSLSSRGDTRSSTGSLTLSTGSSAGASQEGAFPRRRNQYPSILIPTTDFSSFHHGPKSSSVPPTPPPKIPISPQVMSALQRAVPALNNTPSLAAESQASERASTTSMSSPQTPNLDAVSDVDWDQQDIQLHVDPDSLSVSAPSTTSMSPQSDVQLDYHQDWDMVLNQFPPVPAGARAMGCASTRDPDSPSEDERERETRPRASVRVSNAGVLLSSTALETLQHIEVYESSARSSSPSDVDEVKEMHELPDSNGRPKSMSDASSTAGSGTSFSSLSVPSPGGFFSSLEGHSRRTWAFPSQNIVPTSAIAERFYNCPWRPLEEDNVVEHIVECAGDDDDNTTEGPPTAKAILSPPTTARRIPEEQTDEQQPLGDRLREAAVDPRFDYDEGYQQELQSHALANLDRTSMWLQTQTVDAYHAKEEMEYLNNMDNERNKLSVPEPASSVEPAAPGPSTKGVRFLEPIQEEPAGISSAPTTPLPPIPAAVPKNSIFYRGFQYATNPRQSRNLDTFLQSNFRYEAVQAARLSMMQKHISYLNGKYEPSNPYRPPYRGPFAQAPRNSTLPQVLADKAMFNAVEKEQDVLTQLKASTWAIDALKYLNGNRLIPSPAAKRLARAATTTAPSGSPNATHGGQIRVLDLGGHATCEWAWHIAREYPGAKVYSAVTFQQPVNSGLRGPANHEYVSVHRLWKLPFADNQFDLISARSLHMLLKSNRTMMVDGEKRDEFDLCLQECFRCLKPRGFLEYLVIDSEIARAGPYGSAISVEFGFNLKTRGYDPCPTKPFLSKLRKAKFSAIKRAWMFLPMGSPTCIEEPVPGSKPQASGDDTGVAVMGSTKDVASITGLLGGWMWEQWMLRLQIEMGREDDRLLEGMPAVFEEGRKSGAGWRCLNGWAMKPRASK